MVVKYFKDRQITSVSCGSDHTFVLTSTFKILFAFILI